MMPKDTWHQMIRRGEDFYRCTACSYMGTLLMAIRHIVQEQRPA